MTATYFNLLLFNVLRKKSTQLMLVATLVLLGIFTSIGYNNFLYLQAQNISQLSVYNLVLKPLSGLALLSQGLMASISASMLVPYFFQNGQQGIFIHSSRTTTNLVGACTLVIFLLSSLPLIYFATISFYLLSVSPIATPVIIATIANLFLVGLLFTSIAFLLSLIVRRVLPAFVTSIVALIILVVVDEFLRKTPSLQSFSIFLDAFIHARDGLVIPVEILRNFIWSILIFYFCIIMFQKNRGVQLKLLKPSAVALVASLVILLGSLSNNYLSNYRLDLTSERRSSLEPSLLQKLSEIDKNLTVTAVINDESKHDEIKKAVTILKQALPKLELKFTNRLSDTTSKANSSNTVQNNGAYSEYVAVEMVDQQSNLQRQVIQYPFKSSAKESLTNLIFQLSQRNSQWIAFVEGHGEASPFGQAPRDLSQFYQSLTSLGWPIAIQNFSKQQSIPSNTKVLIIAAGQKKWLPAEVASVIAYLNAGGNFLLLREQHDQLPKEISQLIGVDTEMGVLVDWQGYQSGTPHPAIVIVNQFTDHPVTSGLDSFLAFPWAKGLAISGDGLTDSTEFKQRKHQIVKPIITTNKSVWSEFDINKENLSFDEKLGELQQSFTLGVSYQNNELNQRGVVIGDSSFLSNAAINNYDNHQFALNIISWILQRSNELLDKPYQDSYIAVSKTTHFILNWFFSTVIPVIILLLLFPRRLIKVLDTRTRSSH